MRDSFVEQIIHRMKPSLIITAIHPKKSLGQHFLTCEWALDAIVDAARLVPSDTVLEIGPGTGALTRALASRVKKVIAVEKDELLAAALTQEFAKKRIANVKIHEGDILKNIPPLPHGYKIVANIPYYLTARLLRLFLEEENKPVHIVLMIQKEVAERITSKPPHENLLALSVQAFGTPSIIKTVPSTCFSPRPKIDSAIISISDISDTFFLQNQINPQNFFRIMRLAFSQKRKMLSNSLSVLLDKPSLMQIFTDLSLNPKIRPEELSLDQWAQLILRLN